MDKPSPLFRALNARDSVELRRLLRAGVSPDERNPAGLTPLMLAAATRKAPLAAAADGYGRTQPPRRQATMWVATNDLLTTAMADCPALASVCAQRHRPPTKVQSPFSMRPFKVQLPLTVPFVCLLGCGSGEALRVTSIQLGRALNADSTVAGHTTSFAPRDTVYVSILTAGAGSGTIGVRWMYAGRVLGEAKKQVSYRDDAATEFHLQSAAGFPQGDYTVEAFLDGQSRGTREFRVEKQR
jgi:hypothetical protein